MRTLFIFGILAAVLVNEKAVPSPADPRANTCVWRKDLESGKSIIVERAYVYDYTHPSAVPHFQYVVLLESPNPTSGRSVLWMRTGWEYGISSKLPHPEIEILDATLTLDGKLLVLFNQYAKCWAYRITPDRDRNWTVYPSEKGEAAEFAAGPAAGMLGEQMRDGTISLNREANRVVATCHDGAGIAHSFLLSRSDRQARWEEQ